MNRREPILLSDQAGLLEEIDLVPIETARDVECYKEASRLSHSLSSKAMYRTSDDGIAWVNSVVSPTENTPRQNISVRAIGNKLKLY